MRGIKRSSALPEEIEGTARRESQEGEPGGKDRRERQERDRRNSQEGKPGGTGDQESLEGQMGEKNNGGKLRHCMARRLS